MLVVTMSILRNDSLLEYVQYIKLKYGPKLIRWISNNPQKTLSFD